MGKVKFIHKHKHSVNIGTCFLIRVLKFVLTMVLGMLVLLGAMYVLAPDALTELTGALGL